MLKALLSIATNEENFNLVFEYAEALLGKSKNYVDSLTQHIGSKRVTVARMYSRIFRRQGV